MMLRFGEQLLLSFHTCIRELAVQWVLSWTVAHTAEEAWRSCSASLLDGAPARRSLRVEQYRSSLQRCGDIFACILVGAQLLCARNGDCWC